MAPLFQPIIVAQRWEDDGLVWDHGEAIGKCFIIEWFASLLKNG
jgi:hypothetical protein